MKGLKKFLRHKYIFALAIFTIINDMKAMVEMIRNLAPGDEK